VPLIDKYTKEGEKFIGNPKKVSWERLWTFSGGPFNNSEWPKKNIHTDLEFARKCGLPSVAASATQFQGYVIQLMIELFGIQWLYHGTMDVKFIKIVDAGDTLTAGAEISKIDALNGVKLFILNIFCENQRGEKVLVGSATGQIGDGPFQKKMQIAPLIGDAKKVDTIKRPSLEPWKFIVTPELNQQYLYAEEDFHEWYIKETDFGPPIVHPALILNMSNGTRSPSFRLEPGQAGVHTRDETFFISPAKVGSTLKVSWKWVEAYEKRGRLFFVSEALVIDDQNTEILRRFIHSTIISKIST